SKYPLKLNSLFMARTKSRTAPRNHQFEQESLLVCCARLPPRNQLNVPTRYPKVKSQRAAAECSGSGNRGPKNARRPQRGRFNEVCRSQHGGKAASFEKSGVLAAKRYRISPFLPVLLLPRLLALTLQRP